MASTLGEELKRLRESRGMTLRQVEEESGISNGYITQLENDKIREPSPNILHKLSLVYKVPYEQLMKSAGYFVPARDKKTQSVGSKEEKERSLASYALSAAKLTEEEEEALIDYLRFLRFKKKKK